VTGVNDAPSFTSGGDVTVNEDSAPYSATWATDISAGPANESGQTVSFEVSNANNSLFAVQPAIGASGTLTFTTAANANGSAMVNVILHDNGGTDSGGADSTVTTSFILTVTAVNDAPSFTKGADQTVNEDAAAQSVAGWATSISSGPANESGQAVDFIVSNNNNPLFSAQPVVSPTGTLTYTPAPNANGSATVSVKIHDDGGTANGGVNCSAVQTFTITVRVVNDKPSFTASTPPTVLEDAGARIVSAWALFSAGGGSDEASQTAIYTVSSVSNPSLFSAGPAVGASGTLTYTPAANANGNSTFTVTVQDNGGTGYGGVDTSAPQTFTITVTPVNDAPAGTDKTVTTTEDTDKIFAAADFGFTDPNDSPANALLAVKITT